MFSVITGEMVKAPIRTIGFLLEKIQMETQNEHFFFEVSSSDLKSLLKVFYLEVIKSQSLNNLGAKGW